MKYLLIVFVVLDENLNFFIKKIKIKRERNKYFRENCCF